MDAALPVLVLLLERCARAETLAEVNVAAGTALEELADLLGEESHRLRKLVETRFDTS